jgi:hypothetical protein
MTTTDLALRPSASLLAQPEAINEAWTLAERISRTDLVPKGFRGNPEVTFAAKAKGGPVPAFVDIDGERKQATPFVERLTAGTHVIVFRRAGAAPVQREITVVPGKAQKVLVEMDQ